MQHSNLKNEKIRSILTRVVKKEKNGVKFCAVHQENTRIKMANSYKSVESKTTSLAFTEGKFIGIFIDVYLFYISVHIFVFHFQSLGWK